MAISRFMLAVVRHEMGDLRTAVLDYTLTLEVRPHTLFLRNNTNVPAVDAR